MILNSNIRAITTGLWLLVLALCSAPLQANTSKKVLFFNPAVEGSPFFSKTISIMRAAALDLGLELEIVNGNDDRLIFREQADAIFSREALPDYMIMVNERHSIIPIMVRADKLGIHTIVFNGGFSPREFNALSSGPTALQHWIGQILPDDHQSGRLLAQMLIEQARAANAYDKDGVIQVIGISGALSSKAGEERTLGMQSYVDEQDDVLLQQVVNVDWNQDEARIKTFKLLRRYNDVSVVWTAADTLALGAAEAIVRNRQTPGVDVFTAGVDWLPIAYESIRSGALSGSVGGHIYDGAWALVVIYDHIRSHIDSFVDERTQFQWADRNNLDTVEKLLDPKQWRQFSYSAHTKSNSQKSHFNFGAGLFVRDAQ